MPVKLRFHIKYQLLQGAPTHPMEGQHTRLRDI